MSNLSTLPKGDSAWLLRKAIERIIDQVSVLETNIGVSTSGNSANTQIIFNDDGTLRGDAGLVFDKTTDKLTIAGNVQAASATITGDLTAARLIVTGGTIPTNGLWLATTNTLEFAANSLAQYRIAPLGVFSWYDGAGGTRMTLNSTGLGVGVSPSYKLHVQENASNVIARFTGSNTNGSVIDIINTGTGGGSYKIGSNYTIGGAGEFAIYDATAAATRLLISSTGNVGIGVTPSAGKGCLQLSSGINFPATQVASSDVNTLDDYKEAAFTPIIEGGTIAGTGTYSSQVGRYTKVGNLVTVQILIAWTAHTGTGNLSIANLPYTSSSVSGLVASATIGYVDGLALTAGNTPLAYIQNNSSKISLLQTPTGGGSVSLVAMDTAATIAINVTYMV